MAHRFRTVIRRLRLPAVVAVALSLIVSIASVWPASHTSAVASSPGPGTNGVISASGSASPSTVQIGAQITLSIVVTPSISLSGAHVLLDVFPQGNDTTSPKTYGCVWDNQSLNAGVSYPYSCTYSPPQGTAMGGQHINAGVFNSSYGMNEGYVNDLATFTIQPAPPQYEAASLTINPSQAMTTTSPLSLGINSAVYDGQLLSVTTTQFLADTGIHAVRYPGGSTSDVFDWRTTAAQAGTVGCQSGTAQGVPYINSSDTFTATAQLVQQTGGSLWVTVNYGSGTPQEAADWVRDANAQNHFAVRNWEIGNEIYFSSGTNPCGNGEWDQHSSSSYDAASYIQHAPAYIQAMRAVDPSIKIAIPVNYDDAATNNLNAWSGQVIAGLCGQFDTLDVHPYAQQPSGESDSGLLAYPPQKIPQTMAFFRGLLQAKCPSYAANIAIQIGEVNSVTYNPGKQTVSAVNALFLADDELTWLEQGVSVVQPWALRNGVNTGGNNSPSLFGSLYTDVGDYGALANAYRPQGTPQDYPPGDTHFPAAAAEQLVNLVVGNGGRLITIPTQPATLGAHAVLRPDGSVAVLLINRDPTDTQQVTLHLPGYTAASMATTDTYGPTEATRVDGRPTVGTLAITSTTPLVTVGPYAMVALILQPTAGMATATATGTPATTATADPTRRPTVLPTPTSTATQPPATATAAPASPTTMPPTGIVVVSPLTLAPNPVAYGHAFTGQAVLKNAGQSTVTLPQVVIALRPPGGTHQSGPFTYDLGTQNNVTLAPGQSLTVQGTRTFASPDLTGTWDGYLTYETANGVYHDQPDVYFRVVSTTPTATSTPPTPPTATATATASSGSTGVTASGTAVAGDPSTGEDDVTITTTATLTKVSLTIGVAGPDLLNPRGGANTIPNTTLTTTANADGSVTYVYTLNQGATLAPGSGLLAARFDFANSYGLSHSYAGDTYSLTTTTSSGATSTITGHF